MSDRFRTRVWRFREGDVLSEETKNEWRDECQTLGYDAPDFFARRRSDDKHHYIVLGVAGHRPPTPEERLEEIVKAGEALSNFLGSPHVQTGHAQELCLDLRTAWREAVEAS